MYRSPSSAEATFLDPDELLASSVRAGLVEPGRDQVVQPTTALRFAGKRVAQPLVEEVAEDLPLDHSVAARIANVSGVWGAAIVSRTGETRGVASGPFGRAAFVAFALALANLRRRAAALVDGANEPFAVRVGNRVAFAEAFASDVHLVVVDPSFDTRRAQQLLAELGAPPPPATAGTMAATAGAFARPEAPLTGHWDAIPSDPPAETGAAAHADAVAGGPEASPTEAEGHPRARQAAARPDAAPSESVQQDTEEHEVVPGEGEQQDAAQDAADHEAAAQDAADHEAAAQDAADHEAAVQDAADDEAAAHAAAYPDAVQPEAAAHEAVYPDVAEHETAPQDAAEQAAAHRDGTQPAAEQAAPSPVAEPARPVLPTLGWLDRCVLGAPDPWLLLQRVILAARVRPHELEAPPAAVRQAQIVAHLERMSR